MNINDFFTIKINTMRLTNIIIIALFTVLTVSCANKSNNETKSETPTVTTPPKEDDKKVKFKLDGKKGELEIETDKADVEIK